MTEDKYLRALRNALDSTYPQDDTKPYPQTQAERGQDDHHRRLAEACPPGNARHLPVNAGYDKPAHPRWQACAILLAALTPLACLLAGLLAGWLGLY